MISGLALKPAFVASAAASKTARACIAVISGYVMPRRQPRKPSIGLNSCSSCTRCAIFSTGMPSFCARSACDFLRVREELVQRRIEETDRGREALQRLEDAEEVVALIRQQLGERGFAVVEVVGEDHLAHRVDAVALEEHVLGAGEADADGAERDGVLRSARACRRWCGRRAWWPARTTS